MITLLNDGGSSASFTSGNQVDGLPLAPSTDILSDFEVWLQSYRAWESNRDAKVGLPRILMGQAVQPRALRWYLQLAVNRQPGYRHVPRRASLPKSI